MWLFLSTEAMFFAALFSVWFVLRSSAGDQWPDGATMHARFTTGLMNTVVLMCSGGTAWMAVRSVRHSKPAASRFWIVVTLLLGGLFLGIKAWEVRGKYEIGLVGVNGTANLRSAADALYVSALNENLKWRLAGGGGSELAEVENLELVQQGLVAWTARQAGRTPDPRRRQEYFDSLATLVFPAGKDGGPSREFLTAEEAELKLRRDELRKSQEDGNRELAGLQSLLVAGGQAAEGTAESSAEIRAAEDRAKVLTLELSLQNTELTALEQRLRALERFLPAMDHGINEHFGLRLPVAIAGSRMWSATWILLTGMHALHMLAGMLVWIVLLLVPHGGWFVAAVENCALYWHFVDVVWIAVFVVIYCL